MAKVLPFLPLRPSDAFDSAGNPEATYLFRDRDGQIEFLRAATELAQLNDFCLVCLQATLHETNARNANLQGLSSGATRLNEDLETYRGELVMDAEETTATWLDTQRFLVPAMCLLLLASYLEKTLRSLATDLARPVGCPPLPRIPGNKVQGYLEYLTTVFGSPVNEPASSCDLRIRCQRLRNAFAHGEWDEVREAVAAISVRGAFQAVSDLLSAIEEANDARFGHGV